jgi:hypothetical protein
MINNRFSLILLLFFFNLVSSHGQLNIGDPVYLTGITGNGNEVVFDLI